MNQVSAKFKEYVRGLRTRREKFSLVKLMETFLNVMSVRLFGSGTFDLVKPYYLDVDALLSSYKLRKKSSKNPIHRKNLRKETAKKFFSILEQLGAIVPKWLSAIPDGLHANEFEEWKEKTSRSEFKFLTGLVKSSAQLQFLRNNLCLIADTVADTSANKKLRELVIKKIETEFEDSGDNFPIGTPTIVKK